MDGDVVQVRLEADILIARQTGKALAGQLGFSDSDAVLIATAISEIARNMLEYARGGMMGFKVLRAPRSGLEIRAEDQGPGIKDLELAMRDGYSTGGGLGLGLPGAKRLMDEFQIESRPGAGTTVVMRKWVP
ncbi:MAG TPA: anti-sigma regulatory factor [Myxococcales bacterium]|nr:anti-sigma regulatory factor [Myxococcales bacterium]